MENKRTMLARAVTVLVLLISTKGQTQSITSGGSIDVPPSPTAASLVGGINSDVDLYTGTLKVQVPIFELKSYSISSPVVLSYDGGGVRVDDVGGNVGINWTLLGTGMITRNMRGLPDEYVGSWYIKHNESLPAKGYLSPDIRNRNGKNLVDYFASASQNDRRTLIDNANKTGSYTSSKPAAWDTEPDEFFFNVGKHSGKFVFDKDGEIQIIPHQNLKITKVITSKEIMQSHSPHITSFEMIDADGVKYVFGNQNVTSPQSLVAVEITSFNRFSQSLRFGYMKLGETQQEPQPGVLQKTYYWASYPSLVVGSQGNDIVGSFVQNYQKFTSTWYLTKIASADGDEMTFTYVSDGTVEYVVSHDTDLHQLNLDEGSDVNSQKIYMTDRILSSALDLNEHGTNTGVRNGQLTYRYQPQDVIFSTNYNSIEAKKIRKISAKSGVSIEFESSKIGNTSKPSVISEIIVKGNTGQIVKHLQLQYGAMLSDLEERRYRIPRMGGGTTELSETSYSPLSSLSSKLENMALDDHLRLFLTTIVQKGANNGTIKLYEFGYNFSQKLPRRLSYQQDEFGYFNGNPAGHKMKPTYYNDNYGQLCRFYFSWSHVDPSGTISDPDFEGAKLYVNQVRNQIGALNSVRFPTGGRVEFFYQKHRFASRDLGGLKLVERRTYPDENSSKYETVVYEYSEGVSAFGLGANYLMRNPTNSFTPRANLSFGSGQFNPHLMTKGGFAGYGKVKEIRPGLGWKEFNFYTVDLQTNSRLDGYLDNKETNIYRLDGECTSCHKFSFPSPQSDDQDHRRGMMKSLSIFNEAGNELSSTLYHYEINPFNYMPRKSYGMKPGKHEWFEPTGQRSFSYAAGFVTYCSDWVVLTGEETHLYDESDPGNENKKITTTTVYDYRRPSDNSIAKDLLARRVEKTIPTGEKLVNERKFLLDYYLGSELNTSPDLHAKALFKLKEQNRENSLIESVEYVEDGNAKYLTAGNLLLYEGGFPRVKYSKRLRPNPLVPFTTFNWSRIEPPTFNGFTFEYDRGKYDNEIEVQAYDAVGNPTSIANSDGTVTAAVWDHNATLIGSITKNPGPHQHSTSFFHKPLIGINKIIDAQGISTYYDYDQYGRLKSTKDDNYHLLERIRYHYRGEEEALIANINVTSTARLAGQAITFSSSVEMNEYGSTTYSWDFGNGHSVSGSSSAASHTYSAAGTYTVTVTKTNPNYKTARAAVTIVVNPALIASACVDGPVKIDICGYISPIGGTCTSGAINNNSPSTLKLSASGGCGSLTYRWEWQDSAGNWYFLGQATQSSPPPGFINRTIGIYKVRCIVTDGCNHSVTTPTIQMDIFKTGNCN